MFTKVSFSVALLFLSSIAFSIHPLEHEASSDSAANSLEGRKQVGMKLGDFHRKLLEVQTICYEDCTQSCDESCTTGCDDNCNSGCDESCNNDCDSGCDLVVVSCDKSCDSSCDSDCDDTCFGSCDETCNTGCDSGCNSGCIDYYPQCPGLTTTQTVNWDQPDLAINASLDVTEMENDQLDSMTVQVTARADYRTRAKYEKKYPGRNQTLQFTYVLDTHNFGDDERKYLKDANKCENRRQSSFENRDFKDYWQYTNTPSDPDHLGTDSYLTYPDPNIWNLSMQNAYKSPCGQVVWSHSFSVNELLNDCGFEWGDLGSSANTIDLIGNFYLIGLSPDPLHYNSIVDYGEYFTQILMSSSVDIGFTKASSLNPTLSPRFDLFSNRILRVGIDCIGNFSYFGDSNEFAHFCWVWTDFMSSVPSWMKLINESDSKSLLQPSSRSLLDMNALPASLRMEEIKQNPGDDCFALDSLRCWQIWRVGFALNSTQLAATAGVEETVAARVQNVLGIELNFTQQTTYACTEDTRDNITDLCKNFSVSAVPYEKDLITLDPQCLQYDMHYDVKLNETKSESAEIEVIVDDIDVSEIIFYEDETYQTERNLDSRPFCRTGNETVFAEISVEGGDIVSEWDVTGVYVCVAKIVDASLLMQRQVSGDLDDLFCFEFGSDLLYIGAVFDVISDDAFALSLERVGSVQRLEFELFAGVGDGLDDDDVVTVGDTQSLDDASDVSGVASVLHEGCDPVWISVNVLAKFEEGGSRMFNINSKQRVTPSNSPTNVPSPAPSLAPSVAPTDDANEAAQGRNATNVPTQASERTLAPAAPTGATESVVVTAVAAATQSKSSGGSGTTILILMILCGVFGLCVVGLVFYIVRRKRKRRKKVSYQRHTREEADEFDDDNVPDVGFDPTVGSFENGGVPQESIDKYKEYNEIEVEMIHKDTDPTTANAASQLVR